MYDQRTRLVLAELQGEVMHRAGWEPLGEDTMAAAVAEVRAILAGRDDGPELLAYVAGIITGARAGTPELQRAVVAASICVAAGADESQDSAVLYLPAGRESRHLLDARRV